MNRLNNGFKKLLFILPLLTFLLALSSFTQYHEINKSVETSTIVQYDSNHKLLPTFVLSDNENKDLVYNESEPSETEIEVDWINFYSFEDNFLQINATSEPFSDFLNFHESNRRIPLYDLFCNWKLHLS
ncbi:hypothetical protein [Flavobacterium sp. N2270]|uniref:hypothetical protein n=1 Tax=Flavobacterium sp. N2270 TaxID=2986831 RepID=UPI0022249CC5|nr:hypothetical protein [Flavobacterium sp. N2270]